MAARPASLPMYDADCGAVQRWWQGLAAAMRAEGLRGVPDAADWPTHLDAHWQHPQLLLSQTCGYPLRTSLAGVVQAVGAIRYAVPGCSGIHYRSELMVRNGEPGQGIADFRGRIAAFNDTQSQSGWHSLRELVAPLSAPSSATFGNGAFFAACVETGAHRASLAALQAGRADIAAIDCVTLAGLRRHAPHLIDGLRSIGRTAASPGLPLITAGSTSADELQALRRAFRAACADPALAEVREALFIAGFTAAPAAAWWPREGRHAHARPRNTTSKRSQTTGISASAARLIRLHSLPK